MAISSPTNPAETYWTASVKSANGTAMFKAPSTRPRRQAAAGGNGRRAISRNAATATNPMVVRDPATASGVMPWSNDALVAMAAVPHPSEAIIRAVHTRAPL